MQVPRASLREAAPHLRSIHFIDAGVEYLRPSTGFRKASPSRAIVVSISKKAGKYILMCILMLNSQMLELMDAQARCAWLPLFADQHKGKTPLVVGAGKLSARKAKRMGLHVIGMRRSGKPHRYCDEVFDQSRLHAVLPRADFVVVSAPSTAATDGMIGRAEFALMKETAGFLNFARAQLVDYV
jgi:phosphoglycerate dehydrogenase-like enzyme